MLVLTDFTLIFFAMPQGGFTNSKKKLAEMPIRPLLYTMVVPLMLSLLVQSLYNIVDSIFVARLSELALTAASLVYSIQFLMIAVGIGTAVGLNHQYSYLQEATNSVVNKLKEVFMMKTKDLPAVTSALIKK